MKNIIIILFLAFSLNVYSQTKDTTTYAFPIHTKFTLELIPIDSINYKYHVISMEVIDFGIDIKSSDSLLSKTPQMGTIEVIFSNSSNDSTNFKSIMLIRNNSDTIITYKAEICYNSSQKYYSTSVSDLYPHILTKEIWGSDILNIVFRKIKKGN